MEETEFIRESRVFTTRKQRPWKLVVRPTGKEYEVSKCFTDDAGGFEYIQAHSLSGTIKSFDLREEALEKAYGFTPAKEDDEGIEDEETNLTESN